jgi:hypothetical protein
VDAPQLPDAEASAPPAGPQPPGEFPAFRRALDVQADPSQLPGEFSAFRRAPGAQADPSQPSGQFSAFRRALDVQADPPSASGPTVVMPAISAPQLHAKTVITRGKARSPNHAVNTPDSSTATADANTPDTSDTNSADTNTDSSRPSRLSTTVGISILLGIIAGTALVLINLGVSGEPLAPTAMPTKPVATRSSAPNASASPSPAAAHKADPGAAPSHQAPPVPVPSRSAAPSQSSTAPNHTIAAVPAPGTTSFATITWTNTSEPVVVDIQSRLTKLGYLVLSDDGSQYTTTQKTFDDVQRWAPADLVGYYQNSTDSAIRSFEFDFLQHHRGQLPPGGCSSQTYQALVQATP